MKKREIVSIMMAILSIGVFNACVSIEDRTMTPQERQEAEVVGTVTTNFTSFHLFHIYNKENLKNKSLGLLKEQAQKGRFTGNYDIRNIAIAGSPSAWNILLVWLLFPFDPVLFNVQKITASGDVVSYGSTSTGGTPAKKAEAGQGKLQEAVYVVCQDLIDKLPQRSAIAVLNISSRDRSLSAFIMDELEYTLVDSGKFTIVDRARLDRIREEQNFQMSGDVSDASAVTIGNMLGANIVIIGSIISNDTTNRLTVKALDVKTAQIVTMSREDY